VNKLLRDERRGLVYKYIQDNHSATSEELSEHFNVTNETIRQDLNYLNEKKYVIRTFGGAILRDEYDPPLEQRTVINYEYKQKIAKEALKYINPKDLVVMDAGSTLIEVARSIEKNSEVVIVTNSLEILNQISKIQGITVIGAGGKLRSRSMSFQGGNAEKTIASYNLQKAFISAEAVGLNEGIMDTNEAEASVKRCMIDTAREVTLLADHSKFDNMAHITVCSLENIDRLITDAKTDTNIVEGLRQKGIEVIVV
jgi:DeoR family transcriptional regulator, glucitol operon repressor